jgi:membrane fusion protein (multidrug efflux system)
LDQVQTEYDSAQQRCEQALHQARQMYQSYNTAMAKLNILKKMVSDATVVAPFSGWVVDRYVSKGERVTTNPMGSGAKIATIVKLDPLRLVLTVPQQDIAQVKLGQQVKFKVDSFPDKIFTGEIKYMGPTVENFTRSLTVEALVPNPDKVLRPGFFATAEILLGGTAAKFWVPADAVVRDGDIAKVFLVRDGVAREQIVGLGKTENGRIEVASGVAEGDVVVTDPRRVHDGDKIG